MMRRRGFLLLAAMGFVTSAEAAKPKRRRQRKVPFSKPGHASELPKVAWVRGKRFKVGRKTYELAWNAEVVVNGEKGELGDLKPGMQAMVGSRIGEIGDTVEDSTYIATRVVARGDNQLEKKAQEQARKLREQLRKQAPRSNGKR